MLIYKKSQPRLCCIISCNSSYYIPEFESLH